MHQAKQGFEPKAAGPHKIHKSGALPTDRLFTGQRLEETGLYFYNARYYDPVTGRFLSPDSWVQSTWAPQNLNRYTYVRNNVLNRVDSTGYQDEPVDLGERLRKWWREEMLPSVDEAFYHIPSKGYQGWRTAFYYLGQILDEQSTLNQVLEQSMGVVRESTVDCDACTNLDAFGWRVDSSIGIFAGLDLNVDFVFNRRSREFDIFFSYGSQAGQYGAGFSTGPIALLNLPANTGYSGGTFYMGGTAMYEVGLEADVGIGSATYGCERPITVYTGLGFGGEAMAYGGYSITTRITTPAIKYLLGFRGQRP